MAAKTRCSSQRELRHADDSTLLSLDGKPVSLRDYRGRKVLVFAWASWWGCRGQLPGWQQFYAKHRDKGFEILSIACDAQGADAPRPYHEEAKAEFVTVVDQENVFGALYNLRAVPYGVCVDENGRIVRPPQSISVDKSEVRQQLERWINGEAVRFDADTRTRDQSDPKIREADLRFALGSLLLSQGRKDEAVAEWRKALALDPDNWIIHKQIWAVEHPEEFYEGSVDYGWQKQELRREKESADAG